MFLLKLNINNIEEMNDLIVGIVAFGLPFLFYYLVSFYFTKRIKMQKREIELKYIEDSTNSMHRQIEYDFSNINTIYNEEK